MAQPRWWSQCWPSLIDFWWCFKPSVWVKGSRVVPWLTWRPWRPCWLGYWLWRLWAIKPLVGEFLCSRQLNRFWRTSIRGWVIVPRISRFDHGTYVNVYTRISYILYHIFTYVCDCVYIYMQSYTAALLIDIEATKMKPCKAVSCLFLLVQNCPQCKASEVTLLQQPIIRSDLFKT